MNKETLKSIIVDFQERDLSYVIERDIEIPMDINKIITILGVRRSGKSHLLYSLINKLRKNIDTKNILYINFEDDRLFPFELHDLSVLLNAYYELYPDKKNEKIYLFFDELQTIKNWEKFIRRIYDTENCAIFITGSSSQFLTKEISTSLRGRTLSYEIYPLSFKEFLRFKRIKPDLYSSKSNAKIKNALSEYLLKGAFPEVVNYNEEVTGKILQEYIDLIMYKDIVERFGITNTFLLKYLIKYCFKNTSTLISFNKLYNEFKSQGIKLSRNTIYEYVSYLEDAYALFTVPLYAKSLREEWRNPKKIYSIDTGFKNIMDYPFLKDLGRIYENIVFLQLRRKFKNIHYIKNKQEVDFYYYEDKSKFLVNVCYDMENASTKKREVEGLLEALKNMDVEKGLIITSEIEDHINIENKSIDILPLWKWLLLI